jgi:hypothetical protein
MRKWAAIIGAGAILGYGAVYFALDGKLAPELPPEQPATAAAPAESVVLAQVVEVTDLDPLLDPPSGPPSGVPFDSYDSFEAATPVGTPAPIPLAD